MMEEMNQELLKRYLANTCSEAERLQVEAWLSEAATWPLPAGDATPDGDTKARIWLRISRQTDPRPTLFRKIVRYTPHVAAAVLLLFLTVTKDNGIRSAIHSSSPLLQIEKLQFTANPNLRFDAVELYKVSNETESPIFITTKSNGRIHRIEQQKSYLTVRLEGDPGVMGDRIFILSHDQLEMIPDLDLANELFLAIGNDPDYAATLRLL